MQYCLVFLVLHSFGPALPGSFAYEYYKLHNFYLITLWYVILQAESNRNYLEYKYTDKTDRIIFPSNVARSS